MSLLYGGGWITVLQSQGEFIMAEPLIITYTKLLHETGSPQAEKVVGFLKAHAEDHAFVRRAKTLNKLFVMRKSLVTERSLAES